MMIRSEVEKSRVFIALKEMIDKEKQLKQTRHP
jgi:hypothetical protein